MLAAIRLRLAGTLQMRPFAFRVPMGLSCQQQLQSQKHAAMGSASAPAASHRPLQQQHFRKVRMADMREPEIGKHAIDAVFHAADPSLQMSPRRGYSDCTTLTNTISKSLVIIRTTQVIPASTADQLAAVTFQSARTIWAVHRMMFFHRCSPSPVLCL